LEIVTIPLNGRKWVFVVTDLLDGTRFNRSRSSASAVPKTAV
jgi:hypothetical protein